MGVESAYYGLGRAIRNTRYAQQSAGVLVNTLYPRLSIRYTLQGALQSLTFSRAVSL